MEHEKFIQEVAKLRNLQKASQRFRTSIDVQAVKRQERIIDDEINRLIGNNEEKSDQGTLTFKQ